MTVRCGAYGGCQNEATEAYKIEVTGPVYNPDGVVAGHVVTATISGHACPECCTRHRATPPEFQPLAFAP